jgi:uncharacterized protein with von Willebrand factor type A (vWA) domain
VAGQRFRYGAWRGGPDPLTPPHDVRAAVDALGASVLDGGSLEQAMRDLLGAGPARGRGLNDLTAQARRLRREALRRGNLDGAITRARALLDQALAAERQQLAGRDDDAARFAELALDALPTSTASAVEELSGYEWASSEAAATYRRILDGLRREVLDQRFAGLRDGLRGRAGPGPVGAGGQPGDPPALRRPAGPRTDCGHKHDHELLAAARGEDCTAAFERFIDQHGEFFPSRPGSVDELVDELARRAAAAERLMRSLTPAQRDELGRLIERALADPELAAELAHLSANLRTLRPGLGWDLAGRSRGERIRGRDGLGYAEAAGALGDIADLDALLDQFGQRHPGATLDDVDVELVERQLGRAAADDVLRLRELERHLRDQGWLTRDPAGLHLAPKALRRIGDTALRRAFDQLSTGRRGQHELRSAGAAGEVTGAARPWVYGDEQPIDVVRTVANAVRGSVAAGPADGGTGRPAVPVRLDVEDFAVAETERRATATVALCVDLSFSMMSDGRWGPMKQTALALSRLIATRYPQDSLQIIGFGRYAMGLREGELAGVEPDLVQGTNLQHALRLAGRHLRRHPGGEPVVLVVTDGEPTAHLVAGGEAVFRWPAAAETITATIAEVDELARAGTTINLFMLGEEPGLRRFVDAVARRCGGRVFTPEPGELGRYVIADYLRARRGRSSTG